MRQFSRIRVPPVGTVTEEGLGCRPGLPCASGYIGSFSLCMDRSGWDARVLNAIAELAAPPRVPIWLVRGNEGAAQLRRVGVAQHEPLFGQVQVGLRVGPQRSDDAAL